MDHYFQPANTKRLDFSIQALASTNILFMDVALGSTYVLIILFYIHRCLFSMQFRLHELTDLWNVFIRSTVNRCSLL